MIEPKVLKGFRDSLPQAELQRKAMIRKLEDVFASYALVPIDTPILEYTEVLLGKGGGETDKQIFRFKDNGDREVAMRFDLTVPLARFISTNREALAFPFKRYHIGKAYRGENTQRGRFREFYQCDFDILGVDTAYSDYQVLSIMASALEAIASSSFVISFSHRGVFNAYLSSLGLADRSVQILRSVDKLGKIGEQGVIEALKADGLNEDQCKAILDFISIRDKDIAKAIDRLETLAGPVEGIMRLREVLSLLQGSGIQDRYCLDASITRGLDYYTGMVFETLLDDTPEIGSVCSGGRYNNLASLYNKQEVPGVGASVGLDRLLSASEGSTYPSCDLLFMTDNEQARAQADPLARQLRQAGLKVDMYLADKKAKDIYSYVDKNHIGFGVTSWGEGRLTLKDFSTRMTYEDLSVQEAVKLVKECR